MFSDCNQSQSSSPRLPESRLEKLERLKRVLPDLDLHVDFERLADEIEPSVAPRRISKSTKMGRPGYPIVLMLKMVILQQLYHLSDEEIEFQCLDRLTFQRFLGLNFEQNIPDAKTLWSFKEKLNKHHLGETLFLKFEQQLHQQGYIPRGGQLVDATLIPVPIQRNSKVENMQIKQGKTPEHWSENKRRQKDTDARWTKKNNQSYYGYKESVNADKKYKLIRKVHISTASEHDSQHAEFLLDPRNTSRDWFADSAYTGESIETLLGKTKMRPRIQRKGTKGKPLSECQKRRNHTLAKSRCRVEHIFAGFKSMGGKMIRTIGLSRAKLQLNLKSTAYNMLRLCSLKRVGTRPF